MKPEEVKLMETLVCIQEDSLFRVLKNYLNKHYNVVYADEGGDYIYAPGTIPVMLVAHMDTVFLKPPDELFYDKRKGVMLSLGGCGFDDRAGIFAIIKIIAKGYRPSVLFTNGEEDGCVGAQVFVSEFYEPVSKLKYIIQLDRRGENDCVFYDCDNPEFTAYICDNANFIKNYGSFSDISVLCPCWGIAGVNLSVGYFNEHTDKEVLYVNFLAATIRKVKDLLDKAKEAPYFSYERKFNNYV
jgi:hypothetical protein